MKYTTVSAEEFRHIRIGYGLTIRETAKMLNMSHKHLVAIEHGQADFKQRYAAILEQAIGTKWYEALRAEYAAKRISEAAEEQAARERRLKIAPEPETGHNESEEHTDLTSEGA